MWACPPCHAAWRLRAVWYMPLPVHIRSQVADSTTVRKQPDLQNRGSAFAAGAEALQPRVWPQHKSNQ
jgi:hypothetical protein